MKTRLFLLSPAHCGGRRAQLLLRDAAAFPLAASLRGDGAPLGVVFAFLSGLYFRGKLAYAERFGVTAAGQDPVLVITPTCGLLRPETRVTREDLCGFADVDVATAGERFRAPLLRDVSVLAATLQQDDEVVLLGSIATTKYTDVLVSALGSRLLFPAEFVGRGDMSRGALMLRAAADGEELRYVPVVGATTCGTRARRIHEMFPADPVTPTRSARTSR